MSSDPTGVIFRPLSSTVTVHFEMEPITSLLRCHVLQLAFHLSAYNLIIVRHNPSSGRRKSRAGLSGTVDVLIELQIDPENG